MENCYEYYKSAAHFTLRIQSQNAMGLVFLKKKLSKKVDILIFILTILELSNILARLEIEPFGGVFVKQDRKRFEVESPSFVLAHADCNQTRNCLTATTAAFLHPCFILLFILDVKQLLDML